MCIVGIAIKTSYGVYYSNDFISTRTSLLPNKKDKYIPGFITSEGCFLNEKEALIEARLYNQINRLYSPREKLLPMHLT